jgi:hypothetical protein
VIDWPWRSPDATRRALADRIATRYPAAERQRRLREVAYRRLLSRLFASQPDDWVVKGGAALLLRLDPNRTSNDIDIAYVREAGEHAVALRALREAVGLDLGDFFNFEVGAGIVVDEDHPLEQALSVPVVARIGEQEFARFSIDLALPREDVEAEKVATAPALTGVAAVDQLPPIAALTFAAQVADKACATFERHGKDGEPSSRARDLADLAMIAKQVDLDGDEVGRRLRFEEQRRLAAGTLRSALPSELELDPKQESDWRRRWKKATRDAPIDFDDALRTAKALLDPALAREVRGMRWRAAARQWDESPTRRPESD